MHRFRFDFQTNEFSFRKKPLLELPKNKETCWSANPLFSITGYAIALANNIEENVREDEYLVRNCSNEASFFKQFTVTTGKAPSQTKDQRPSLLHPIFTLYLQNDSTSTKEQRMLVHLTFFQALHIHFSDEQKYPKEEFSFSLFYVTWQWYAIAKRILQLTCNVDSENPNYPLADNPLLFENFRLAYIAINKLVDDPTYLPIMQLEKLNQFGHLDDSTLVEKYRLAIHADEYNPKDNATGYSSLIYKSSNDSDEFKFHPKFIEHPIQVKNLISQHLLPAYDLETAFQLGKILQKKQDQLKKQNANANTPEKQSCRDKMKAFCKKLKRFFKSLNFHLLITLAILIVLPVAGTHIYKHTNFMSANPENKAFCISVVQLLILALFFFFTVWRPLKNLLVHLLLPRLMAGVLVGYMAFILQENAYHIPNYIFGISNPAIRCLVVFSFACACVSLGYFYLRADISQFTRGKKKSIPNKRAATTLLFATTISLAMGLLALVLMTDPKSELNDRFLLGPFGWIDPCLMIFYVPLSFLTGLVSQFIFEEKSLTAPTWSAESMN